MAPTTGNTGNANASKTDLTPASSGSPKGKEPVDTPGTSDKMDVDNDNDSDNKDGPAPFELKEAVRVSQPDKFDGTRKSLNSFILQIEIYFSFNEDKFVTIYAKSLYAASFLRLVAQN